MTTAVVTGLVASRDMVTVNLYGKTATIRKLRGYVPSVGDVVRVLDGGDMILALDSMFPHDPNATPGGSGTPSVPDPEPGRDESGSGELPLLATGSMSWRPQDGWLTWDGNGDVYQGSWSPYGPYKGLWFYGTGPQTALAGATVTDLKLWVQRRDAGGDNAAVTVNIYDHPYTGLPAGEPALGPLRAQVALGRGEGAWVTIAPDVGQALVSGAIKGFATAGNPYAVLAGVHRASNSGTLKFTWHK